MKNKSYTLRFGLLLIITWFIKPTMAFSASCDGSLVHASRVGTSYSEGYTVTFSRLRADTPVTNWGADTQTHFSDCLHQGWTRGWRVRGLNYSGKDIVIDGRRYSVYSLNAYNYTPGVPSSAIGPFRDLFGVILEFENQFRRIVPLNNGAAEWTRPWGIGSQLNYASVTARVISLREVPPGTWGVGGNGAGESITEGISYSCSSQAYADTNFCTALSSPSDSRSYLPRLYVNVTMPTCNVNYSNVINLKKVNSIDFKRAVNNSVAITPFALKFDCPVSTSGSSQIINVGMSFQDANQLLSRDNVLKNVAVNASNATFALYLKPEEKLLLNSKIPVFIYRYDLAAPVTYSTKFYVGYISTAANTTPGAVKSTVIFNMIYN